MADSYVQLPSDGVGKKLRTRTQTIAAQTVHEQAIYNVAEPTWYVWSGATALAANKHHLSILNTGAQVIKIRKLFLVNAALAAVTGVGVQYDIKRITACSGGSAITAQIMDSGDTALSSVTILNGPTSVTEGAVLFPWYTNNDEIGLTGGFPQATIQSLFSLVPEGLEIKEPVLNQNEGLTVKQITSTVIGSVGVLAVITKAP